MTLHKGLRQVDYHWVQQLSQVPLSIRLESSCSNRLIDDSGVGVESSMDHQFLVPLRLLTDCLEDCVHCAIALILV